MEALLKKIHIFLLICLSLCLPFSIEHISLTGLFTILLSANAIGLYIVSAKKWSRNSLFFTGLFAAGYIIYLWSFISGTDTTETTRVLEKKLSLLLFPFIINACPPLSQQKLKLILLSFVFACINVAIYSLAVATAHYVLWNDVAFFSYRLLSATVGMHPVYLSLYFCFAVAIVLYLFYNEYEKFSVRDMFLHGLSLFILTVAIILLAGRVAVFILIVELMVYVVLYFRKKTTLLKALFKAGLLGVLMLGVALIPRTNRIRLKEAINYKGQYSVDTKLTSGAVVRPYIWSCSWQLIKERPLLGHGAGDTQQCLTDCYAERNYVFLTEADHMSFNAHNQFMEIAVGLGLIGLLVFLFAPVYAIREALHTKNALFLIFIGMFIVSCITESMLERQAGIAFFAFFNSLLFFCKVENQASTEII